MIHDKILLVDDEQNLLDSLKRQLRSHYTVITALGPEEGLAAMTEKGPFSVIVSDLRMPVMDGIEFLAKASTVSPDSVRIMLTGNADLKDAIKAVNEGNIYRFLTKPCDPALLIGLLDQGIKQYQLVTAEKELLEKTLKGSIQMLIDLLSMISPEAFGRSSRLKHHAAAVAEQLGLKDLWKIETAAMLSQIGCVTLPDALLNKIHKGEELTEDEEGIFASHPKTARTLLSHIPRMEEVSESIYYQSKFFNGMGFPNDSVKGEAIPIGARILKVVSDFDFLESKGIAKNKAMEILKQKAARYDAKVIVAMEKALGVYVNYVIKEVYLRKLEPHMLFAQDVKASNGRILVSRGQSVSATLLERLINFAENLGIDEPIKVIVPRDS
jgi:response regulator RpfG family c-di-GMP phosphodiesterase